MESSAMSDREVLELAAKAAGYTIRVYTGMMVDAGTDCVCTIAGSGIKWNPLTDDGDALRLAVKLRLTIDMNSWSGAEITAYEYGVGKVGIPAGGDYRDRYAATRRAIVRAAAEIGRGMG